MSPRRRRGKRKAVRIGYLVKTPPGVTHAFVPDLKYDGRWIRTDECVLFVDCERCRAKVGEPCRHLHYVSWTHYVRRKAWTQLKRLREQFHGPNATEGFARIIVEYDGVVKL